MIETGKEAAPDRGDVYPAAAFRSLNGVYEPSAIQQLPDGRFLVVEDEKQYPFSLLMFHPDGRVSSHPLEPGFFEFEGSFWKLDDLEGLALDRSGFVYAITSHSRADDGKEKKSRQKLVRFRVDGVRVVDKQVIKDLKPALVAAHPVLATAAELRDVKAEGGLNIEALEVCPESGQLMIGFRSPLLAGCALIARVENTARLFEAGEEPRVSPELIELDLGGNGIRGLAFVPALNGYLVIGGPVAKEQVQFQLWFWSGRVDDCPRRVTVPGLTGFEHAEGVSPALINGQQRIILVSDDGSREDGRFGRYLMLEPDQLQIEAGSGGAAEPEAQVLVQELVPGHVVRAVAGEGEANQAVENVHRAGTQIEGFIHEA